MFSYAARQGAAQEMAGGEVRGRREGSTNLQGCGEAGGGHSVVRHKTGCQIAAWKTRTEAPTEA